MAKSLGWLMMEFGWSRNLFGANLQFAEGYFERIQAIADHIAERTGTEAKKVTRYNYDFETIFGHLDPSFKPDDEERKMAEELEEWLEPQLFKWSH